MKRWWLGFAIAVLLVCLCGTALAVENSYGVVFHPVKGTEYTVTLPEGMVATVTKEDGTLHIEVDSEATDWAKVLAGNNSPQWVYVDILGTAPAGETVTGAYAAGTDLSSKEGQDAAIEFQEWYITDWQSDMMEWSMNDMLGEIDPVNSLFVPRTTTYWPATTMVCWINSADPTYRYYERLDITLSHTEPEAFSIPVRYVPGDMMEPSRALVTSSHLEITQIDDGSIVYKILSSEALSEQGKISMAFNAPAGAAYAKLTGPDEAVTANVQGGKATFMDIRDIEERFTEGRFALAWYASDDTLLDYGSFVLYITLKDDAPSPNYVDGWQPVPANRLTVENGVANAGLIYTYDESIGTLHTSFNGDIEVTGELDQFIVKVAPPQGAAYYRCSGEMGWSSFRGPMDSLADEVYWTIMWNHATASPAAGGWEARNNQMLRPVEAGDVTVYLQEGSYYTYGGGASVVYWYASEEDAQNNNVMLTEFVCFTNDPYAATEYTDMVESEDDIRQPVKKVTCVGRHPWRLKIQHHPQKGKNARHYELQMVDRTGSLQVLKEPVVFYMPYPDDLKDDAEYEWKLQHFNRNYSKSDNVKVTCTEFGLRFEVSSLSPFVISYEEIIPATPTPVPTAEPTATPAPTAEPTAEPTATPTATPAPTDVPKTGDESPLALLVLMAALSALGLGMIATKRKLS